MKVGEQDSPAPAKSKSLKPDPFTYYSSRLLDGW